MSKKLYAALLPVLAVVAFASMTGAAQAAPHWYVCEKLATETGKFTDPDCEAAGKGFYELKRLPFTSAKTQVVTWGRLTLTASNGVVYKCKVIDAGNIWNVALASAGRDNIEVFQNYECTSAQCEKGPTITSLGLPWETELLAGPPIRDSIKGIRIVIKCEKPALELEFTGELTPEIVNGSPTVAKFGVGSGSLKSGTLTGEVTGTDRIVGFENAENIDVFNP
jgi:hypothetical protein